jgi:RNA polymerase sigma-70 factor (ECF subfamily)
VTTPTRETETQSGGAESQDGSLAAGGDRRAFERLYRTHVPRIHGLARRMMGDDDATEATQDVFVRAWEKLGTFRGEAQFGTWLYRLAINVILTRRGRRAIQWSRHTSDEEVLEAVESKPSTSELTMDFQTAIGHLPEGAKQVFVLHDIEGYRHEEIASLLGVTSGTTKAQLHRARMLLRRNLQK